MASAKSLIAAGVLAMPCVDAFVAPGSTQGVSSLRGTAPVPAQSESKLGAYSAFAAVSAAAVLSAGAKKHVARKHVACKFSKESQIGAMDPVGFFDPAGLCTDEATFKDFRAKEIKHGRLAVCFGCVFLCLVNCFMLIRPHESWRYPECRLAMMGALGMLTQSLVQLPGFEDVPKDVTAATVGNGQAGFLLVIGIIAVLEAAVFVQDDSKEPGNFGNPLPWFDDYSDEMRAREINNGRIAMFAAIGQISAGLYTGKAGLEQFGVWEVWRSRRLSLKTLLFLYRSIHLIFGYRMFAPSYA